MAISGKDGIVIKGGTTACVTEWSVNNNIERLDGTNTCSNGLRELVSGINEWTGSFTSHDYDGVAGTAIVSFSNVDVTISGTALIDLAITAPVQGTVVEYVYDVAFTGTVTVT